MAELGDGRYGKSDIRVVRVERGPSATSCTTTGRRPARRRLRRHLPQGDNTDVMATDTMRNTVYARARRSTCATGGVRPGPRGALPAVVARLPRGDHQPAPPHLARIARRRRGASARIPARRRRRRPHGPRRRDRGRHTGHRRHPGAHGAQDDRVGLRGLPARPVHDAAGDRRPHPGHDGRRSGTTRSLDVDWTPAWERGPRHAARGLRDALQPLLQQTLYAIGEAIIAGEPAIDEVRLSLPNRHHLHVDSAASAWPTSARCSTRPRSRTGSSRGRSAAERAAGFPSPRRPLALPTVARPRRRPPAASAPGTRRRRHLADVGVRQAVHELPHLGALVDVPAAQQHAQPLLARRDEAIVRVAAGAGQHTGRPSPPALDQPARPQVGERGAEGGRVGAEVGGERGLASPAALAEARQQPQLGGARSRPARAAEARVARPSARRGATSR